MEETTLNLIWKTIVIGICVIGVYFFLKKRHQLNINKKTYSSKKSDLPDVIKEYSHITKAIRIVRLIFSFITIPILMIIAAFVMYLISKDPASSAIAGIFAGVVIFYIKTDKLYSILKEK